MKVTKEFAPVTIVLDTKEEVARLVDSVEVILNNYEANVSLRRFLESLREQLTH